MLTNSNIKQGDCVKRTVPLTLTIMRNELEYHAGGINMMKTVVKRCMILLMIFGLTGCTILYNMGKPYPYTGDETALFTMIAYSIPEELFNTTIEIMEEDKEGRCLFMTWISNTALFYNTYGNDISTLVVLAICQDYNDEKTYYYEDDCFVIRAKEEDISTLDIEQLKQQNDWDKPLDYNKMTEKEIIPKEWKGQRPFDISIDIKAKEAFSEIIETDQEDAVFTYMLDDDGEGRILFIITVLQYNNVRKIDNSTIRTYLEMIDTKEHDKQTIIEKIEDMGNFQQQIKSFKQHNNWRGQRDGSLDT